MDTVEIFDDDDRQLIRLPEGMRLPEGTTTARQDGARIVLEPAVATAWPDGFFDAIHIADPTFARPDQGALPKR